MELMVVLAVAAILFTVAAPNFHALYQRQQLTSVTNEFFAAINLARSEAIHRGARVDLVPQDGIDWASGWIVFVDDNGNQLADIGEHIIFSREAVNRKIQISSAFTDASKPYLAYNGTGRSRTNSNGQTPQLGTISFILDKQIRRIKLNFSGRPRTCNPENDKSCIGVGS